MGNQFGTDRVLKNMEQLKSQLPTQLANQAQNYFTDSWRQQGWDGASWQVPKRRIRDTPEWKYPKKKGLGRRTRATLVQTGRLRRAVSNSIRRATFDKVELIVAVPYAKYHNEGAEHLPKRHFMGDSPILRKKQVETIKAAIDRIWQA
jgi:phage gpG-like protein